MAKKVNKVRTPARADHIGSLLRPERLVNAIDEVYGEGHSSMLEEERQADLTSLHALEDELITDAVRKQEAAGVDVISDGEFRRFLFTNSFYDAVSGVGSNNEPLAFYGEGDDELLNYEGPPIVERRLKKIDSPAKREAEFLASVTDKPFKVTFPAGSWFCLPFVFKAGVTDREYKNHDDLIDHAVSIQRELMLEAIEAGAKYIQLDFPTYPFLVDERWLSVFGSMGVDPDALLESCLRADKAVIEGLPSDVEYAMHICRGNWKSRWLTEGSLEPVAERIFSELPYDRFLVEWEDTKRDGDYSPLRFVPDGPTIAMGIVSSKDSKLESEDELIRHMEEAAKFVDMDRLAISPQCGFASSARGNELDEDAQWRKLELLSRVADRLWPR
jgi:5-methyltetrahydropteroyltriglutamate--homocysteine methyltransferase